MRQKLKKKKKAWLRFCFKEFISEMVTVLNNNSKNAQVNIVQRVAKIPETT